MGVETEGSSCVIRNPSKDAKTKIMQTVLIALSLIISSTTADTNNTPIPARLLNWGVELVHLEAVAGRQCKRDLTVWLHALTKYRDALIMECLQNETDCIRNKADGLSNNLFAVKQLDAFGRLPSDFLNVNAFWFGSWEECMNVAALTYKTKYCYVSLGIDSYLPTILKLTRNFYNDSCALLKKPQWSVCVPHSCSEEDIINGFRDPARNSSSLIKICSAQCRALQLPWSDAFFWIVV